MHKKEDMARYIAENVDYLTPIEREELQKDIMKLKIKSIRFIKEQIEDVKEPVEL